MSRRRLLRLNVAVVPPVAVGIAATVVLSKDKDWASGNNEVWLWDVATRAKLSDPLAGHTSPVRSLAFAPNGSQLASGSMDHTARLWTMPRPR
ncbi:hypothetical protein [Nocardia sp. NPDC051981]|uniref:WD40 repeat domain-containing protein n=1 Tax=Nocardia sp. NPDC051981 TaxID=3155417 RepID=UPI00343000F5